jgi:hypothetical protein
MKRLSFSILLIVLLLFSSSSAFSQIGNLACCKSTITYNSGNIIVCPAGDGENLSNKNCTIHLTVIDYQNNPVPGIPAEDIWLVGGEADWYHCGQPSRTIDADAPTDANGYTTISGTLKGSGCTDQLYVVVQSCRVDDCVIPGYYALDIKVRSPDLDLNGTIDIVDMSIFMSHYYPIGNPYDKCSDFNDDGIVDIIDFSIFAEHYQHSCN